MKTLEKSLSAAPFQPWGPFQNGHLQTIYAATLWNPSPLRRDQVLKIAVGDNSAILCEYNQAQAEPSSVCIVLVHGLEGSANSKYLLSAGAKFLNAGFDVIRMNMRNCGGTAYLSQTFYNSGMSGDVLKVAEYAQERLGYNQVFVVGFSLGANQVLKLGGELGRRIDHPIQGICAVSPPLNLAVCARTIIQPRNWVYNRHFYRSMCQTLRMRARFHAHVDPAILKKTKNLYDFDEWIIAPEAGFANAEDYYAHNSSGRFLKDIQIPTLILHAMDDPVIPFHVFEPALALNNPQIQFKITPTGGHVGFLNSPWAAPEEPDNRWMENRILEFVLSQVNSGSD